MKGQKICKDNKNKKIRKMKENLIRIKVTKRKGNSITIWGVRIWEERKNSEKVEKEEKEDKKYDYNERRKNLWRKGREKKMRNKMKIKG